MNALILNIPKGFWIDDWKHNFINVLPMGVFAIANYCNQKGHRVFVANAGVFQNRNTSIEKILNRIKDTNTEVLGMPLHWHLSGHDVLKTAEFIKKTMPGIKIVLGGLTASVYPAEIMNVCSSIDGIIVGDGELPFCKYLDVLGEARHDPDLRNVPNLMWRMDGIVHDNGISHVAGNEQMSQLDFSPQGSIFSMAEYANGMRIHDAVRGITLDMLHQPTKEKLFFMSIGRGCSYNCVYCSGSKMSHRQYCGRDRVTVRSPASVLVDFQRCYAAGFRRFHIGFDPAFNNKEYYYQELFASLRRSLGNGLELIFEAYGLPSGAFLELAAKSFAWVGIILSPCFFTLEDRRLFKGYFFSNDELEEKLKEISSFQNCQGFVYYAVTSLENWSQESIDKRISNMRSVQDRYGCEMSVLPIYAEPGSPWVSFPGSFGKHVFQFSFHDFFTEWQRPFGKWNDRLTGIEGTERVMRRIQAGLKLDTIDPR